MNKEEILNQLKCVRYPGFSRDIVSFGLIKDVVSEEGKIKIVLAYTTESPEKRQQIEKEVQTALSAVPEIKTVLFEAFEVPRPSAAERTILEQKPILGVHTIIAVASGKGGVGKSTVAVNLACALQLLGHRVGLLDADIYGPSVPMMMGETNRPQVTAENKLVPHRKHGVVMMSIGFFLERDNPVIWRGPMVTGALRQLLNDTEWGMLDYLVVDLPPGTGDVQLSLMQLTKVEGAVIVTTPQDVALIDAKKGVMMFQRLEVKILGVVENMSYFVCPHCHGKTDIFSEGGGRREARRLKVPFLGEIPIDAEVRVGGDQGIPIVVKRPESEVARAFLEVAKAVEGQIK